MMRWLGLIPREYFLLGVLALGVYLPGFTWGAPYATEAERAQSWGVDDGTPLQPLADLHNILQPKPDRNFGYPLMHSFATTGAYAPYLGYLFVTKQFRPATGFPFGFRDPVAALRMLSAIAHLLSVLMAVGTVLCAYDAARALWCRRSGVLAALAVLSMYPLFYYGRTGNPEAMMMFFFAASIAALARVLAHGFTVRRAVALGLAIGFAAATKEQVAAAYLALPIILLGSEWLEHRTITRAVFWRLSILAGLVSFVAFGASSGLFADPTFFQNHLAFGRERMAAIAAGQVAFMKYYPWTAEGHQQLAAFLLRLLGDCMTPLGVLAGLAGVAVVARRAPRIALLALTAASYLLILFISTRSGMLRYLMPPAFVLFLFVAALVESGLQSARKLWRLSAVAVALAVIGLGGLRGVDLTYAMMNDNRFAAGAWIQAHLPPGSVLEYFGANSPMPPLPAAIQARRVVPFLGAVKAARRDDAALREAIAALAEHRPAALIISPDHSSLPGEPFSATCPPQFYQQLLDGVLGYRLAAHFDVAPLLPWVQRPALDYPSVSPAIRIFVRHEGPAAPPAERKPD